jgi:prepilin-type N-terminal cleavage/methylation domain-containing protein
MKSPRPESARCAFTLIELLLVIVILAILAAVVLPVSGTGNRRMAYRAYCINNQKQVALGLFQWAEDHSRVYPPQAPSTNGGTAEAFGSGGPSVHFGALSNYLVKNYRVLICPSDKKKVAATNFTALTDGNVSYFFNLDAAPDQTNGFVGGDRHLEMNHKPVPPGRFTITTNMIPAWTTELHPRNASPPEGVMAFVDGHAEVVRKDLTIVLQRQTLATNRLAVP